MKRTLIGETIDHVGETIRLCGWVDSLRKHGKITFADIRDRSGLIQTVGDEKIADLKEQSAVEIIGKIVSREEKYSNPKMATGKIEVAVISVKIMSLAQDLPFDAHQESLDVSLPVLLDHRSASLKNKKVRDIFMVQQTIVKAFREHMSTGGFTEIQAPTIVATATEGGSQVFPVEYFNHKAFLAQSPQFYKQILVSAFERVFTVAHAYRAEPSITTRHMTEYVGLDVELGFIDSWKDVLLTADGLVKYILKVVEEKHTDILEEYGVTIPKTIKETPVVKLTEAHQIIFERTKRDIRGEPDMDPEGEREICRWSKETYGSDMVFISHYPTKKRPFYTYPDPENPEETLSFDLIGCGVEWITGGQRIHDFNVLVKNIEKMGGKPENYEIPYLQAFRYGMPPEGGFCLGLERITMDILGLDNIRRATLYPRDMERIDSRLSQVKN